MTDLLGGSRAHRNEPHTYTYTFDEYLSHQSIDEQPYQKVVVENVENFRELKQNIRNVIRK